MEKFLFELIGRLYAEVVATKQQNAALHAALQQAVKDSTKVETADGNQADVG